MTTHIMLDIETWGKTPGCDIRSIGAVVFDPFKGITNVISSRADQLAYGTPCNLTFHAAVENQGKETDKHGFCPYSNWDETTNLWREYKLTRDPETVKWWNDQSEEARKAFINPFELRSGLMKFSSWITNVIPARTTGSFENPPDDIRLWANDPQFDVAILEAVFRVVGLPIPWHYRAPRSFRTVTELAGMKRDNFKRFNFGVTHNSMDDAISQAMIVCEAYKRLGLNNG